MKLKPWFTVTFPRDDLQKGKPLDAAEFAVHLDQVQAQKGPEVYWQPEQFFERTFLTRNLTGLAAEVIRRLAGETTETSAVFNMATQFGGGKTHALTLLYHLAQHGPQADRWPGVARILAQAGLATVPRAKTAILVGQRFDPRGGDDDTPRRETPWGEIAWQLAGAEGLALFEAFDQNGIAPGGDTIGRLFELVNQPILILMDELINYVSRYRKLGLGSQMYNFLQNLSEEARNHTRVVLAISIPASELEMTAEDQSDYERFKKMIDRLGKAVVMSAEAETAEIIRRRLFEWDPRAVDQEGRVLLDREAERTCRAYADWVRDYRQQLPSWFPIDNAYEAFAATYPFHPIVISMFERKWQTLPRFQRTRGILRLLALWVSHSYTTGYQGVQKDALISLGTAPLENTYFRSAVLHQLGNERLEGLITTDICGKKDSHAVRLDEDAVETIQQARLHRKVATVIFFESNGGQQVQVEATLPEIRLAVSEPDMDIGNVETILEMLSERAYYLRADRMRYRFDVKPNINKLHADRRASIQDERIMGTIRERIQDIFKKEGQISPLFFQEPGTKIPDRAMLNLIVLDLEWTLQDSQTLHFIETMTREHGASARTFKNALIWAVAHSDAPLKESARRYLAWSDINDERDRHQLDEIQGRQLERNFQDTKEKLTQDVWQAYKNVVLLGKDNQMRVVDLSPIDPWSEHSLTALILRRLQQDDDIVKDVSPNFLVRKWPPHFKEWSTKAVRDAFFASPQFPRLLDPEAIKTTIITGVKEGILAYVGKMDNGKYETFYFENQLSPTLVEITDETFIITREMAEAYLQAQVQTPDDASATYTTSDTGLPLKEPDGDFTAEPATLTATSSPDSPAISSSPGGVAPHKAAVRLSWSGEVSPQKWMTFYTKVLSRFANSSGLKIAINVTVTPDEGIPEQKIEETRVALQELGLNDDVKVE